MSSSGAALPFPSPTIPIADRTDVLIGYLDFFRGTLLAKVAGLSEAQLRGSTLPSGWSPLELVHHLTWVERRWLEWGFEGVEFLDPWGEEQDGRWHVPAAVAAADVLAGLTAQGAITRRIASAHRLDEVGLPSDRWDGADPPTLERVLLHLLQEHARHAGHLDVARELLDGTTGE